ncbi:histone-lysine N-methyltransferase SETMAR-like [Vespa mandarinia]|uniref:histone-lysine N-methyltransferase SETMAR-like n=1 Tax=Vespa mandarinia TaxID=7446 RepID=UPI001611A8B2|nr:histone-lysine N-methyltransferase SETMAR-like [Vespa mandarinia]
MEGQAMRSAANLPEEIPLNKLMQQENEEIQTEKNHRRYEYHRNATLLKTTSIKRYSRRFARFRSDDFSLKNAQRSGRPVKIDEIHIKVIIDSGRHSTTRDIAEKLNVSYTYIDKKFKMLAYVKKLDLWIPHQLKEIHMTQRISICDSLLKRNETDPFLQSLITGDEK